MLSNNECLCKRVLVYPRVDKPINTIVMVQVPSSGSVNLDNYYTKAQTDDLLSQKLSTSEFNSPSCRASSEEINTMFNLNNNNKF